MNSWAEWTSANWLTLLRGSSVSVEPDELPHPATAGFVEVFIAEPFGQDQDWALSLTDGSRLHAHRWNDGRMVVHRDQYDPAVSLPNAVRHYFAEAPSAKLVVGVGLGALCMRALRRVLLPVLVLSCVSCAGEQRAMPIGETCSNEYVGLLSGYIAELAIACRPMPVAQCGLAPEIDAKWNARLDEWEARCEKESAR